MDAELNLPWQGPSWRRRLAAAGVVLLLYSLSGTAQDAGSAAPQVLGTDSTPDLIVGPASGALPIRVYSSADGALLASASPFVHGFTGGVRLAAGDVNGDGITDVVAAMGPGGGLVRVLSGADGSDIVSGYPFGSTFLGGVNVAVADADGDGRANVIASHASGGGEVRVYSGTGVQLVVAGPPFGASYSGGVYVAAGDVTGDGQVDFVMGQATGGMVRVISGTDYAIVASGFPYGETFTGGVHVATGDVNGDGREEVIVGPGTGDGRVRIYDVMAETERGSFEAYAAGSPDGTRVATADLDGDGRAEIITAPGPSAPPLLRVFDGVTFSSSVTLLVYDSQFTAGVFVAAPASRLRFTSPDTPSFTEGQAGHFTISTSSSTPLTALTLIGPLPAGLTFTDNGHGTGTLAGTPDFGTAGPHALTVAAVTGIATPVTQPLTIHVAVAPNAAPSFVSGMNQLVNKNAGPQTVPAWATAISPGPPREAGQTVSFVIAGNTNPALFSVPPMLSANGTLAYTPVPDASGAATITAVLRDKGGTDRGGVDTSPPQQFSINVLPCAPGTYTNDGALLDGAAYKIRIPDSWNGILIVYARPYEPVKPVEAEAFWSKLPEFMDPFLNQFPQDFETPLLAAGYALAGSTLRAGGWAVEEGREDLARLKALFSMTHCRPAHTIVAGFDMGGLIALESMEEGVGAFDGAIAACAPATGMTKQVDRALVQNMAIDATMAWPAAWGTPGDVRDDLTLADIGAVHYLTLRSDRSALLFPAFEFVRVLLPVGDEDLFFETPTPGFETLLRYFTLVLADLERRLGGPVAQSPSEPYTLSFPERAAINASIALLEIFAPPCNPLDAEVCPLRASTAEQFLVDINALPRATPDPAARAHLAATNDLTGLLTGPVITLHTTLDPLFPASGTTTYLDTVTAAGQQQQLLRVFTDSQRGHCAFDPRHLLGALAAMRSWLETGVRPSPNDNSFFPGRDGFTRGFNPGPWPF